ncbi:hypothetical protein EASAB2608_08033 [Streptomyces sp. EAS-AB2608]|nr:hypothetical protein EASAB2608_08033 [Streptomyces sp. EAS-AB2608]
MGRCLVTRTGHARRPLQAGACVPDGSRRTPRSRAGPAFRAGRTRVGPAQVVQAQARAGAPCTGPARVRTLANPDCSVRPAPPRGTPDEPGRAAAPGEAAPGPGDTGSRKA